MRRLFSEKLKKKLGEKYEKEEVLALISSTFRTDIGAGCLQRRQKRRRKGIFRKKEINLVIASEPPSLHPGLATDSTSGAILDNVFEGLTTRKDGEIVNAVAEDITISDDQLTYTFKLRDAKWSNGDPVTAQDFEYAWKWALNPENVSEYASILYPIKNAEAYNKGEATADEVGIKAEDDKTLVVTLEQPTPYFLELTAFKTYYPVNKNVAEKNLNGTQKQEKIM